MPDLPTTHQVEMCSMGVIDDGFVMDLANSRHEAVRIEFPAWVIHQLMRVLPHLDAAIQQKGSDASASLIAYPVVDWNVERAGFDQGIALWLRNDRQVDTACSLSLEAATALYHELGDAIAGSAASKRKAPSPHLGDLAQAAPGSCDRDPAVARPS